MKVYCIKTRYWNYSYNLFDHNKKTIHTIDRIYYAEVGSDKSYQVSSDNNMGLFTYVVIGQVNWDYNFRFEDYFISEVEMRKLKLKKIEDVKFEGR